MLKHKEEGGDFDEIEKFIKIKIRLLLIEEYGENFTADYMFDADSLALITNKLVRMFCHVLQFKIGSEDITDDKITERLIINNSMRVSTHSNIRSGTWFMDIKVSLE